METNDIIVLGYEKELADIYSALIKEIESGNLSMVSVVCYFKHIPIKGRHGNWSDKIYNMADKCHKMLYNYCLRKQYIDKNKSYEDYLKEGVTYNY